MKKKKKHMKTQNTECRKEEKKKLQTEWINWKLHTKLSDMVIKRCGCREVPLSARYVCRFCWMASNQNERWQTNRRLHLDIYVHILCANVVVNRVSSCITHMYRLQMHSICIVPSLYINTITRLVHTFAMVLCYLFQSCCVFSASLLLFWTLHRCA